MHSSRDASPGEEGMVRQQHSSTQNHQRFNFNNEPTPSSKLQHWPPSYYSTLNIQCWMLKHPQSFSTLVFTITVYVNTDLQPSSRLILYSSTLSPQPSSTSNIDPQPLLNKPWKTELYTGKVTTHYTVHSMIWSGQAWHNIKTHLRFVFEIWKRPVDFL